MTRHGAKAKQNRARNRGSKVTLIGGFSNISTLDFIALLRKWGWRLDVTGGVTSPHTRMTYNNHNVQMSRSPKASVHRDAIEQAGAAMGLSFSELLAGPDGGAIPKHVTGDLGRPRGSIRRREEEDAATTRITEAQETIDAWLGPPRDVIPKVTIPITHQTAYYSPDPEGDEEVKLSQDTWVICRAYRKTAESRGHCVACKEPIQVGQLIEAVCPSPWEGIQIFHTACYEAAKPVRVLVAKGTPRYISKHTGLVGQMPDADDEPEPPEPDEPDDDEPDDDSPEPDDAPKATPEVQAQRRAIVANLTAEDGLPGSTFAINTKVILPRLVPAFPEKAFTARNSRTFALCLKRNKRLMNYVPVGDATSIEDVLARSYDRVYHSKYRYNILARLIAMQGMWSAKDASVANLGRFRQAMGIPKGRQVKLTHDALRKVLHSMEDDHQIEVDRFAGGFLKRVAIVDPLLLTPATPATTAPVITQTVTIHTEEPIMPTDFTSTQAGDQVSLTLAGYPLPAPLTRLPNGKIQFRTDRLVFQFPFLEGVKVIEPQAIGVVD